MEAELPAEPARRRRAGTWGGRRRAPARRIAHEGGGLDLLPRQARENVVEVEEQRRPYRVFPGHPSRAEAEGGGDTGGRRPPRRSRRAPRFPLRR
jgi:hypothetical protein